MKQLEILSAAIYLFLMKFAMPMLTLIAIYSWIKYSRRAILNPFSLAPQKKSEMKF